MRFYPEVTIIYFTKSKYDKKILNRKLVINGELMHFAIL